MNKKQKILSFSGMGIIALSFIAYIVFSDKTVCKKVEINIKSEESDILVNKKDIEKTIFDEYGNVIGKPIDEINLENLEKKIENIPFVKNAEVYKKINGVLGIDIYQRKPVLRVFSENGSGFYIDKTGEIMPLSDINSARVLIASGNIKFTPRENKISVKDTTVGQTVKDLYKITKFLNNDDFLKKQIIQIYVTQKGEYELIPLAGNHKVMLGDIFNYKKKLNYLKYFYLNTLRKEGWQKYKYINLKYKGQIVCTKRQK